MTSAFAYPSEGYAVYPDCMVILRESKHQELAHQFIDYMLRPAVAAANAMAARTTTTNAGARELFPEAFREQSDAVSALRHPGPRRMGADAVSGHAAAARPDLDGDQICLSCRGHFDGI